MRIRSLHPSYLDSKGLVALRREALLAQHVLAGKTIGYTQHPQLLRFRQVTDPLSAINQYLRSVWEEAQSRGYRFQKDKIGPIHRYITISVTDHQLAYEFGRLSSKVLKRDPLYYSKIQDRHDPIQTHPLFETITGPIAGWEKIGPTEHINQKR